MPKAPKLSPLLNPYMKPVPALIALGLIQASCTTTSTTPTATTAPVAPQSPATSLPAGVESILKIAVESPAPDTIGLGDGSGGVSFGPGSALTLVSRSGDAIKLLYVSDRGPNTDLSVYGFEGTKDKPRTGKVFLSPAFAPRFGQITVNLSGPSAKVDTAIALSKDGKSVSGIPPKLPQNQKREIALDTKGKDLGFDPFGIDPEGIVQTDAKTIFIAEEYRPSIYRLDATTGAVDRILEPGKGLPQILSRRRPNRGLEGLTRTPSGALVAMMQSTLELGEGKQSTKNAHLIRGIRLQGDSITQFAYPIDDRFAERADAKLGDITALDENRFLILMQGKMPDGQVGASIQLIDISKSCDPGKVLLPSGQPLEFAKTAEELQRHCTTATVEDVVDLRKLDWNHEKTEGLAVVGNQELLVINDNDFGVDPTTPRAPTEILYIKLSRNLEPVQELDTKRNDVSK